MPRKEIFSRRNLPHWYMPGAAHFVTYRLAGTIPVEVLSQLREKREDAIRKKTRGETDGNGRHEQAHKQFFVDYDKYLDQNRDRDWLANPKIAAKLRENLYHHHGKKYYLLAYCFMPNHVHALLQPIDPSRSHKLPACDSPPVAEPYAHQTTTIASKAACGYGEFPSDETSDGNGPLSEIMHSLKSDTANVANSTAVRSRAPSVLRL